MNQEWLIKDVLKHLDSVPDMPNNDREYLSLEESQRIVDETIDYLGAQGDETEYTYVNGHRKRLAHSLSMIPIARDADESCLDVGSYGYMALWAQKYLGYARVMGIEWHPDIDDKVIHRSLRLNDETVELHSHNFDISQPAWSIDDSYDTVLFFEVLEHINVDPMGVMERILDRLKPEGTLVMSVPNAISYKAFKEFLVGMPPWTYWFYEPDLEHEPRHCFEYTPIVFKSLIKAAGLRENAFRTIYAYTDQAQELETLEIARSFGINDESFGETMIINATRTQDSVQLRYPDVLYSPDGYYKNVYPHLHDRLDRAIAHFRAINTPPEIPTVPDIAEDTLEPVIESVVESVVESRVEIEDKVEPAPEIVLDLQEKLRAISNQNTQLKDQIAELLFACDSQLCKQEDFEARVAEIEIEKTDLESEKIQAQQETQQTREWANELVQQKYELEARVNELLFTCDCYMRKEKDTKTLIQETEGEKAASMIEAQDSRVWAEDLSKENADLRGQVNELLFACDCYLQQINDPDRCVQVIRERRFRSALRVSKSVVRKTPVLRSALRPVYRGTKKFIKRRM